jgi:long-chain acyl-CoA synthetase
VTDNLDGALHAVAEQQPDHPAIVNGGTISYRELDERVERAAALLRHAGVRPGSTVGLHLHSGVEYIVQTYAIWRCGACSVPIATELADSEKATVCRKVALDFIVGGGTQRFAHDVAAQPAIALAGSLTLTPVRSSRQHPPGFRSIDAAFIRFTSGTTGSSKGVVLSHATIRARIRAANEAVAIGVRDRVVWLLSMSYHFAATIVAYLSFGATILLPANNLAEAIVELCERERATLLYGSPMHCALLADFPRGRPLPDMRLAISTTATLDVSVARRFHERYGVPVAQALGIIEIGLPCINIPFAGKQDGSVGPPLPAYRLRLEDVGFGPNLAEISFSGPGFLDAYYDPWQTREHIAPDGWFSTHDVGEVDGNGCLYIRGRTKDVISVFGMKFFPQEVERVLAAHPAVKEAVVFGVRDARAGELPQAMVVLRDASQATTLAAALRTHCIEHLAWYKVPERFDIVDALPRTASGKVLHRV